MEEVGPQKKRRASPRHVVIARQASGSVKAFSDKLGTWQEQAVRLQAILRYSKSDEDKAGALRLVALLRGELEDVHAQLDLAASMLSDGVRGHSRFQDSVRSVERLEALLAGMAKEAKSVEAPMV